MNGKPAVRRIDAQNRIHLPADILKALGVAKGDYVSLAAKGDVVELRKVKLP